MSLDHLLATSDVVSVHVPLSPQTRHLIDRTALSRMKRSAYLINTSRGAVIDEDGLAWALREGIIKGAGLDVYEDEPNVHPGLLALENVVLVPHMASATAETRTAMYDLVARNVVNVLSGNQADSVKPNPQAQRRESSNPVWSRRVMRKAAVAITRPRASCCRENFRVARGRSFPGNDCDAAIRPHTGCDDVRSLRALVRKGGHARGDGEAHRQADREVDLSCQLLPLQGALHQSDVREAHQGIRRKDAGRWRSC